MEKYINLTSHNITEVTSGNVIPMSGRVARVKSSTIKVGEFAGSPIFRSQSGDIEGLPEPKENIMYIVSSLALSEVPKERTDVVSPGNLQRDEHRQPVGCVGFRTK